MLHAGVMDYEFIVEDDQTAPATPKLSGWETVVFELEDAEVGPDDEVTEGLEELIVALYF